MSRKQKLLTGIKIVLLCAIFLFGARRRLIFFTQEGKDISAYEKAVVDLFEGRNPYTRTLVSYSNPDDPGDHGYAYLPGLMYVYAAFYIVYLLTHIPFYVLWKIPVFMCDLGVALLFVKLLYRRSFPGLVMSLLVWFFNPYITLKHNYVYTDPIPTFFMFLSLYYLRKDDVLSGTMFALSVCFKTFPVIALPVYLLLAKDKLRFIVAGCLVGLFMSLPFMRSLQHFMTFIQGSVLVHSDRIVQGRPFLYYISYYYKVELVRMIPFKTYVWLATFGGWVVAPFVYGILWLKTKARAKGGSELLAKYKYVLAMIPFVVFYLFTPVLNRTYLIWALPIFIMAVQTLFERKQRWAFYAFTIWYYSFYFAYLLPWKDGFHIWHP